MEKPDLGLWIASPESILDYGVSKLEQRLASLQIPMLSIRVKTRDGLYFDITKKKRFSELFEFSFPIFREYSNLIPKLIELRKRHKSLRLYAVIACFVDKNVKNLYRTQLLAPESKDVDDSVCPNNELYKAYLRHLITQLITMYEFDGIILERVRFPNEEACFCNTCQRSFQKSAETHSDIRVIDFFNNHDLFMKWVNWRSQSISNFVHSVYENTKTVKREIEVGMAYSFDFVPGFETISKVVYGQDIHKLSAFTDFIIFDTIRPWSNLLFTNEMMKRLRILLSYVIRMHFGDLRTAFLLHKLPSNYYLETYDLVRSCGIQGIFIYDRLLREDSMNIIKRLRHT